MGASPITAFYWLRCSSVSRALPEEEQVSSTLALLSVSASSASDSSNGRTVAQATGCRFDSVPLAPRRTCEKESVQAKNQDRQDKEDQEMMVFIVIAVLVVVAYMRYLDKL